MAYDETVLFSLIGEEAVRESQENISILVCLY